MITADVLNAIDTSVLYWLATVSSEGEPNVSPKEAFVYNNGRILIAHIASPKSIANLRSNPKVCLSFVNVFTQRGYKVNGIARVIDKSNSEYNQLQAPLSEMAGEDHKILAIISIEPSNVERVTAPSYNIHPEITPEEMISQSLKTYKVDEYARRTE